MLQAIYRGANEKKITYSMSFSRQIIIIETSMSDHNIIQIETNIKIVEEKQNHQIKKSNLSYRTERIACILCMHLGACRFFMHPTALMHLKKQKANLKNASSCILFFLYTHEWDLTENYYNRLHYHTDLN